MFSAEKLAILATEYCLPVSEDKKIGILGHEIARPLIQHLYKHVLLRGGHPEPRITVGGLTEIFYKYGTKNQLTHVSPFQKFFLKKIDGIISIHAETNLKKLSGVPAAKIKERSASQKEIIDIYLKYAKPGKLAIIPYPTEAFAQEAEMSLFEYQDFVAQACFLDKKSPVEEWRELSKSQKRITRRLNRAGEMRFIGEDTDLRLRVEGRKWVNSDGHVNMPSGEVFTGPIENSAQGQVRLTYPGIYMGKEVEDITLSFKDGKVTHARAEKGEELLKELLKTDAGARRIGEIAIGTNKGIKRFTKNMLFDEKMGHTMHLALGRSIPISGGQNESSIHWDILKDMKQGEIHADGELIYKNGEFTI